MKCGHHANHVLTPNTGIPGKGRYEEVGLTEGAGVGPQNPVKVPIWGVQITVPMLTEEASVGLAQSPGETPKLHEYRAWPGLMGLRPS